jgi:hypothetical protein
VSARVVSVRRVEVSKEPALLAIRAYPITLSVLLAASNVQQNLRTIGIINKSYRDLVTSYLDGKVSEYELKKMSIRLTEEYEHALINFLATLDIAFLVRETEEDLKFIEKLLIGIKRYGVLDAFTKQLLRGVIKKSIGRVRGYRRIFRILSSSLEERIVEINLAIEHCKKALLRGLLPREEAVNKLRELAREYTKCVHACRELKVLALSINLGLTGTRSTLLRLEEKADELKVLKARLAVGEITSEEYSRLQVEISKTIGRLKSELSTELKNFENLEKTFEVNTTQIAEVLGEDALELLRRMLKSSRNSARRIAEIYVGMGSEEARSECT